MTKVVRKVFWVWEFEEEEQWLNEMARQGWVLDAVGFCRYTFEPCEPGEYVYKLEMLEDAPTQPKSHRYIEFVEATGAEYVGSYLKWVYFRKKAADGVFELHSDNASKIRHLNRIIRLAGAIGVGNLLIGLGNIITGFSMRSGMHLIALVNVILGALILSGARSLVGKRKKLEKETGLFDQ